MQRLVILAGLISLIPSAEAEVQRKSRPAQTRAAVQNSHRETAPSKPHEIGAGTLNEADLSAIAKLEAKSGDDQFSDDPTLKYAGRVFTITLPTSYLETHYDRDSHLLTVSTSKYSDSVTFLSETTESSYSGQNAYGAKATISKTRGNTYGIWLPGNIYDRKPVSYSTTADGETARGLSAAIRLRLSGHVIKADGVYAVKNSVVYQKSLIFDPTVSEPIDNFTKQYSVAVKFDRAEWIDSRSGSVISVDDHPPS